MTDLPKPIQTNTPIMSPMKRPSFGNSRSSGFDEKNIYTFESRTPSFDPRIIRKFPKSDVSHNFMQDFTQTHPESEFSNNYFRQGSETVSSNLSFKNYQDSTNYQNSTNSIHQDSTQNRIVNSASAPLLFQQNQKSQSKGPKRVSHSSAYNFRDIIEGGATKLVLVSGWFYKFGASFTNLDANNGVKKQIIEHLHDSNGKLEWHTYHTEDKDLSEGELCFDAVFRVADDDNIHIPEAHSWEFQDFTITLNCQESVTGNRDESIDDIKNYLKTIYTKGNPVGIERKNILQNAGVYKNTRIMQKAIFNNYTPEQRTKNCVHIQISNIDANLSFKQVIVAIKHYVPDTNLETDIARLGLHPYNRFTVFCSVQVENIKVASDWFKLLQRKIIGNKRVLVQLQKKCDLRVPGLRSFIKQPCKMSVSDFEGSITNFGFILEDAKKRMAGLYRENENGGLQIIPEHQFLKTSCCPTHGDFSVPTFREKNSLEFVKISMVELSAKIHTLLYFHNGYLPLNSLKNCYISEFGVENWPACDSSDGKAVILNHILSYIPGTEFNGDSIEWSSNLQDVQQQRNLYQDERYQTYLPQNHRDKYQTYLYAQNTFFKNGIPHDSTSLEHANLKQNPEAPHLPAIKLTNQPQADPVLQQWATEVVEQIKNNCKSCLLTIDELYTVLKSAKLQKPKHILLKDLKMLRKSFEVYNDSYVTLTHRMQVKRFEDMLKSKLEKACENVVAPVFLKDLLGEEFHAKDLFLADFGVSSVIDLLSDLPDGSLEWSLIPDSARICQNPSIVENQPFDENPLVWFTQKGKTLLSRDKFEALCTSVSNLLDYQPNREMRFNNFLRAYEDINGRAFPDFGLKSRINIVELLRNVVTVETCKKGGSVLRMSDLEKLNLLNRQMKSLESEFSGPFNSEQLKTAYRKNYNSIIPLFRIERTSFIKKAVLDTFLKDNFGHLFNFSQDISDIQLYTFKVPESKNKIKQELLELLLRVKTRNAWLFLADSDQNIPPCPAIKLSYLANEYLKQYGKILTPSDYGYISLLDLVKDCFTGDMLQIRPIPVRPEFYREEPLNNRFLLQFSKSTKALLRMNYLIEQRGPGKNHQTLAQDYKNLFKVELPEKGQIKTGMYELYDFISSK